MRYKIKVCRPLTVTSGLRQGYVQSPHQFHRTNKSVCKDSSEGIESDFIELVVVIANTVDKLEYLTSLDQACKANGMRISMGKWRSR